MRCDGGRAAMVLRSRRELGVGPPAGAPREAEGGCGVLGLAANVPISGRHVMKASRQMRNRGNGKGGGIAAAGLDPIQMKVSPEVLRSHYLLQIAYLDPGARAEVERQFVDGRLDVAQAYAIETVGDHRQVPELAIAPPMVVRYFCRVTPDVLGRFAEQHGLQALAPREIEDEFVFQNSFRLNRQFYESLGTKRAFVESHARDMLILKLVGYAEQAIEYYRLEELTARVWIAHQRYPTKGRVWHPGGAHPFIGMNEALVHNGDFANYHGVTEYLRQRNVTPQFLTDTEVGALLFDLWSRVYRYPTEVIIEALAPTTERDYRLLSGDKKALYAAVQSAHLHASPDGPWFFIIARSMPDQVSWQLLGITDTAMLRPQVFALYQGEGERPVQIGLVASERQAVNALLRSLSAEDGRFRAVADRYWAARGGSHADGGAFSFTVRERDDAHAEVVCTNKFGDEIAIPPRSVAPTAAVEIPPPEQPLGPWFGRALPALTSCSASSLAAWCEALAGRCRHDDDQRQVAIECLEMLRDRRFATGPKKRSAVVEAVDRTLEAILRAVPDLRAAGTPRFRRIERATADTLRGPAGAEECLVVDGRDFAPEGETSVGRLLSQARARGWRRLLVFDLRGGRFAACGLGPDTAGTRIDVHGDPGDYLASGLDGAEIQVHGDAQDQVAQVMKSGRLVIHGDVGQVLLYGAKGGVVYVAGSTAGRPVINAVGKPRVIINGTCLDYLAESFMAGDPLLGGGFVVVNGVRANDDGEIEELESPYPGGHLLSLGSGGAVYLRDPHQLVDDSQLNGARFAELGGADWDLIAPYLRENEALFGIPVERLLSVDGRALSPDRVYRKIEVGPGALH